MATFYVRADGSNTSPYDTTGKAATKLSIVISSGLLSDNDTIIVDGRAGDIDDTGLSSNMTIDKKVTIQGINQYRAKKARIKLDTYGLSITSPDVVLEDINLWEQTAVSSSAALIRVSSAAARLKIRRCFLYDFATGRTATILSDASDVSIKNTAFFITTPVGIKLNQGSGGIVVNNTIRAWSNGVSGIYTAAHTGARLYNNICHAHTSNAGGNGIKMDDTTCLADYNDIYSYASPWGNAQDSRVGSNNVYINPSLYYGWKLWLRSNSNVIHAGAGQSVYAEVPTDDHNGDNRPTNGVSVDIGAYEFRHRSILLDAGTGGEDAKALSYPSWNDMQVWESRYSSGRFYIQDACIEVVDNGVVEMQGTSATEELGPISELKSYYENTSKPTLRLKHIGSNIASIWCSNNVLIKDLKIEVQETSVTNRFAAAIQPDSARDVTIEGCHIYCATNSYAITDIRHPLGITNGYTEFWYPHRHLFRNNILQNLRIGMNLRASDEVAVNNTFYDCYRALYTYDHASIRRIKVINNVIHAGSITNSDSYGLYTGPSQTVFYDYNTVYGYPSGRNFVNTTLNTNDREEDPLFTDAAGGDFSLQASSPCVDTAATYATYPDYVPVVDYDGNPRPGASTTGFDRGALEYQLTTSMDIQTTPPVTVFEDTEYKYIASAEYVGDAGETGVEWSVSGEPTGMVLDPSVGFTGVLAWTPTTGGWVTPDITLNVTDGVVSDSQTWQIGVIEVNDRPVITSQPPILARIGQQYIYQVQATDEETVVGDLRWRLINAPAGMNIGKNTGLITWIPTTPGEVAGPITVEVKDEGGLTDTQTWTVSVVPVITAQTSVKYPANHTVYLYESMLYVTDPLYTYPDDFTLEVLEGTGYRILPPNPQVKIHIEKSALPQVFVNVRVRTGNYYSNTWPLMIETFLKSDKKNRTQPPFLNKGKNRSR